MSAPFFVPFNNQPASVSVKTSGYTIPAGKYAKVTAMYPDMTVDAATVCEGFTYSTTVSLASPDNKQVGNNTRIFKVAWSRDSGSGTLALHVGGVAVSATASSGSVYVGGFIPMHTSSGAATGDVVALVASGTSSSYSIAVTYVLEGVSLWVPTGTVMGGSKYFVELFNEIT